MDDGTYEVTEIKTKEKRYKEVWQRKKGKTKNHEVVTISDSQQLEVTNCDRKNISKVRTLPYAFTRNGIGMLSSVLRFSPQNIFPLNLRSPTVSLFPRRSGRRRDAPGVHPLGWGRACSNRGRRGLWVCRCTSQDAGDWDSRPGISCPIGSGGTCRWPCASCR